MTRISIIALLGLSACAGQPIPVEQQVATACEQISTSYEIATELYEAGKLTPGEVQSIQSVEPVFQLNCNAAHPPTDLKKALSNLSLALAQMQAALKRNSI